MNFSKEIIEAESNEKFIILNACIKRRQAEKSMICFHHKKLEKKKIDHIEKDLHCRLEILK